MTMSAYSQPSVASRKANERLQKRRGSKASIYDRYEEDPEGYARDILDVIWWDKQLEVVRALQTPPYRVLVKASHKVGKTHLGGGLVNWWYDVHDPGLCLTTAPTDRQVKDLLWKEVRVQ